MESSRLPFYLFAVTMAVLATASTGSGQITFSRDWLAGSGKRSPSSRVTFSRDWLAGTGKRAGGIVPARKVITENDDIEMEVDRAISLLADYLNTQMAVGPGRDISFFNYLKEMKKN